MHTQSGVFADVPFEFMVGKDVTSLRGTVTVRPGEMVIDLPRRDEDGPYTISGKQVVGHFEGKNTRLDSARVVARWSDVGDRFIGVWEEEGWEWYFAFRLSNNPSRFTANE